MADLSHGWGIAVGQDRFLDDLEDQLLAGGEAIVTGGTIWQFRDGKFFCAHGLRVGAKGKKVEHMFEIFLHVSVGGCIVSFRTDVRIPSNIVYVSEGAFPMATKLTARGRNVVRGAAVASLLIVIGAGFSAVGNATENKAVGVSSTAGYVRIVVAPGETLWSLASTVAGSGSVAAAEQQIVDANALSGTDLAAGQRLWVPVK